MILHSFGYHSKANKINITLSCHRNTKDKVYGSDRHIDDIERFQFFKMFLS